MHAHPGPDRRILRHPARGSAHLGCPGRRGHILMSRDPGAVEKGEVWRRHSANRRADPENRSSFPLSQGEMTHACHGMSVPGLRLQHTSQQGKQRICALDGGTFAQGARLQFWPQPWLSDPVYSPLPVSAPTTHPCTPPWAHVRTHAYPPTQTTQSQTDTQTHADGFININT